MQGFARVAAAVPNCAVGDVDRNLADTLELWRQAEEQGCDLVVFPELGLCGYTARDLLHNDHLLARVQRALSALAEASSDLKCLAVVGAPVRHEEALFNAAVAIADGKILAVIPKSYLPNYREFEESRWFRSGFDVPAGAMLSLGAHRAMFGTDIVLRADACPNLAVAAELCEDLWVYSAPSASAIAAGATVIANLSASNFVLGKSEVRRGLARTASYRGKCAYIYTAAGPGESSTDLAFDADAFIFDQGEEVAAAVRFARESQLIIADVDVDAMVHERLVTNTFGECSQQMRKPVRVVEFSGQQGVSPPLRRAVARTPFVPRDEATLNARCWEVFEVQSNALATRLAALNRPRLVLGLSGGVDSTHAALVCAAALDLTGQPRSDLLCVNMPGFGTSAETRGNAARLAAALGATYVQRSIEELSLDVLAAAEHAATRDVSSVGELLERLRENPSMADVTLENVQARLRTLMLMTEANGIGGIVVGTGDLSEKALGWSTYAGDHIAMYDVNAGVPKTLIQFVIRWVATHRLETWASIDADLLRQTLLAVLATPISPELIPPSVDGTIAQRTEDAVGPYELHDFFLFHTVNHGRAPTRILDLARVAFGSAYTTAALKQWLRHFYGRFFANQFKRSCTADGPKVGPVALSPRGDWRMPSDARVTTWLAEIDQYPEG